MTVKQTNLAGLKNLVHSDELGFGLKEGSKEKPFEYNPMFMPVSTQGKPVIKVQTREGFLKGMVSLWRTMRITFVLTFVLGGLALWLLGVNTILAALSAAAGGWCFGIYTKWDFVLNVIMKKRTILEGT